MTLHRCLWEVVVIALMADGTIQLFAPAQIASMLGDLYVRDPVSGRSAAHPLNQ